MLVPLQPELGHLGQDLFRDPRIHKHGYSAHRPVGAGRAEQLGQLAADPFRRHHRQPAAIAVIAACTLGFHRKAELCGEPRGAEHPQRVVVERVFRPSRCAQHLGPQVTHAAERIDELQRRQQRRDGIDGEVAPGQVRLQGAAVGHPGLARVRLVLIAAVGGDLADDIAPAQAHGAELDPGLPDLVGPAGDDLADLFRPRIGGQVVLVIVHLAAQEDVPDHPADQGEFVAFGGEQGRQTGNRRRWPAQQGGSGTALVGGEVRGIRHGTRVGARGRQPEMDAAPARTSPGMVPLPRCRLDICG